MPQGTDQLVWLLFRGDAAAKVSVEIGQGNGPISSERFGAGVFKQIPTAVQLPFKEVLRGRVLESWGIVH